MKIIIIRFMEVEYVNIYECTRDSSINAQINAEHVKFPVCKV